LFFLLIWLIDRGRLSVATRLVVAVFLEAHLDRARQHHDAGEALREGVVDLAGEPLALGLHAGQVLGIRELLLRRGRIPRAYLGVGTQQVRLPEALRQRLNLDQQTAVIVVEVQPNSPAAGAGLLMGDIIVLLGGTSIEEPADLKSVLRPDQVGESTIASVIRGGEPRDLQLKVGERPPRS
jgi:S1-C subfamily serine protease